MRSTYWKDIAELFGIAAIVGSLIFVGLQLKQTQEISRSAAYQSRADTSLALNVAVIESETLLSAIAKLNGDRSEPLTPTEKVALTYHFSNELIYLENVHYQHQNGFVTDEQWQANIGDLQRVLSTKFNRQLWEESIGSWRESFVEEVEENLGDSDR